MKRNHVYVIEYASDRQNFKPFQGLATTRKNARERLSFVSKCGPPGLYRLRKYTAEASTGKA